MRHLGDHAAQGRRVDKLGDAADLVELETDQRLTLGMIPTHRAADLPDLDGLAGMLFCRAIHRAIHGLLPPSQSAGCSASTSRRRACSAETLTLRRAATVRGESWCLSASKVARTTL